MIIRYEAKNDTLQSQATSGRHNRFLLHNALW